MKLMHGFSTEYSNKRLTERGENNSIKKSRNPYLENVCGLMEALIQICRFMLVNVRLCFFFKKNYEFRCFYASFKYQ